MPLANALRKEAELATEESRYPLRVLFCGSCKVLQLGETISPEACLQENFYFSSYSDEVIESARQNVEAILAARKLGPSSLAIEIGSNDGYLLQHYKAAGIPVIGIEPAANSAAVAEQKHGVRSITEIFTLEVAEKIVEHGTQADVIHANNVLAHVPDVVDFARGISHLLKEGGVGVIEVPYSLLLVEKIQFDTIYHEHIFYHSLHSLCSLFGRAGLIVYDVVRLPIHGGSLRIFVSKLEKVRESVKDLLAFERAKGLDTLEYFRKYSDRVVELKTQLLALLIELKTEGKRISAYGASAKGSTLMNFCGIGAETIEAVYDRSDVKAGLYTPGNGLPIRGADQILTDMPDYLLMLSWNFKNEIMAQQREYIERGGKFIVPLPKPEVL
jgi:SAM-dependent methyltransferase